MLTDGTSNCSVHGRSRAVKVNTVVASRQKYLYAHSETHCNELVSGQIHAPAALFPANSYRTHAGPGGLQNASVTVYVGN